jgi:hypothetical protein
MCFVLTYDVVTNGYVKTDLTDAGIFLLCSGGYIAGSGIPKSIVDSRLKLKAGLANEELEEEAEERRKSRRRKKKHGDGPPDDEYVDTTDEYDGYAPDK